MSKTLLIVGATARAAAMSAIRSGFEPWAADLFADVDLSARVPACRVEDYPSGLERALASAPPGPWMYTGALENRPELIDRLSRGRRLYGIGGDALRAVRDPFRLEEALVGAGVRAPRCARSSDRLPRDGSWVRKPLASGGGYGVCLLHDDATAEAVGPAYFQQRIQGISIGAVFVAAGGGANLLGVSRQLLGLEWCGLSAGPTDQFRYCGSIGPLRLASGVERQLTQIGAAVTAAFGLHGIFGIDAIIAGADVGRLEVEEPIDGEVWPIEVNPRYTASVEVLERALGLRAIALHVAACGGDAVGLPPSVQPPDTHPRVCGKAILFAKHDTIVADGFSDWCGRQNRNHDWPRSADIPAPGTQIPARQPIATVLAGGTRSLSVMAELQALACEALARCGGSRCKHRG